MLKLVIKLLDDLLRRTVAGTMDSRVFGGHLWAVYVLMTSKLWVLENHQRSEVSLYFYGGRRSGFVDAVAQSGDL